MGGGAGDTVKFTGDAVSGVNAGAVLTPKVPTSATMPKRSVMTIAQHNDLTQAFIFTGSADHRAHDLRHRDG